MADTMTAAEIETAIDAIETQGRYIALHGLPGACPSEQDCRAFESFMRSGYAAKEKLRRMATAIKQREQDKRDAVHSGIAMALGWMYQEACRTADAGLDIRTARLTDLLERALRDLAPKESGNG